MPTETKARTPAGKLSQGAIEGLGGGSLAVWIGGWAGDALIAHAGAPAETDYAMTILAMAFIVPAVSWARDQLFSAGK